MDIGPHDPPLTIERFRVRMYRSIRDSGPVPIFPLTALVGRRESGKTSLLRAMLGLEPALPAPYSLKHDWPRGHHLQRRPEHVVCRAAFRLSQGACETLVRAGAIESGTDRLLVGRTYGGELLVGPGRVEPGEDDLPDDSLSASRKKALVSFARQHLPPFLFVANDSVLPGAVLVDDFSRPDTPDEGSGVGALGRLLTEAGADPKQLRGDPGVRLVRDAGERIGGLLADRGSRGELSLGVERGRIEIFLGTGSGRIRIDRLPRTERYLLTLDLRFAAARGERGGRPLLLLDGPGRAFRKEEAYRMRSVLEGYIRAGATVLYTARLPFDMELQHSEQVLVLSPTPKGPMIARARNDGDLAVRAALGMTGRASFRVDEVNLVVEGPSDAAIITALSDLFRRSGEPGLPPEVNVTVAGGSHEVAAVAAFLGRLGLIVIGLVDSDDAGAAAGRVFGQASGEDERIRQVELLQLSDAAGLVVEDATIEDLFPTDFYLDVVREVCGPKAAGSLRHVDPSGDGAASTGKIASRLGRSFAERGRRFPKTKVAEALEARIAAMPSVEDLPAGMARPVRRLMTTLRSNADRQRTSRGAGAENETFEA